MKTINYLISIIVLFFILGASTNVYSFTADEIVQKMDEYHSISDNFEMSIRVDSYANNQYEASTLMKGYVNNKKMTLLTFLEPTNMQGRKIIIKDNDMWIVIPKVKNPIRVSASQRLMGGISYGDIARVNYTEGYSAKLGGEETVTGMNSDGTKSEAVKCMILELSARNKKKNYNKIIIWANEQGFLPVKADFFALSGKKMTTVYYTAPKEWDGRIILTKMFLFDQINATKHFSMEYFDIKKTQINDSNEN